MLEEIKNINTSKKDLRSFGYTIGIILFIISAVLFYYNNQLYQNLTVIAAIFVLLGVLIPQLLKPIYLVWMTFAVILGWVMTRVILSVIFYLIMTPIGFLSRLLGEDFLALKKIKSDSYWNHRDRLKELSQDYEKQF
tara:strand:+ start:60 stop:470 length:411 start_codon:yes stop_codon:yes gene_type:complete